MDPWTLVCSLFLGFGLDRQVLFGLESLVLMKEVIIERLGENAIDLFSQLHLGHL